MVSRVQKLYVLLALTSAFFAVELVFGYVASSVALIADAFHMLSDVASLLVGIAAVKLAARRGSTARLSYGWQRAEILGALINSVFLLALCFNIAIESVQRLFEPTGILRPKEVLIVGCAGLGMNLFGMALLGGHSHGHDHGHGHSHGADEDEEQQGGAAVEHNDDSHKHRNMNMHGLFLHVAGDALGSIAVIVSAALVMAYGEAGNTRHWTSYVDPAASLLISVILILTSVPLARSASTIMLHRVPNKLSMDLVRERILKVASVAGVHELHVWALTTNKYIATVHVSVRDGASASATVQQVKHELHLLGIHSTTVQIEEDDAAEACQYVCPDVCETKQCCGKAE
ncbi:Zinc resistance conferring protein [Sorochytrium milnesiophthora]